MVKRLVTTSVLLAGMAVGACTVHQSDTPSLAGPSQLALSLNVLATPDTITQDGVAASTITVTAQNAGGPCSGLPIRLDMMVGGVVQDFGSLDNRNLRTGSNCIATALFTAPPAPPPLSSPPASGANVVTIRATLSGSNALVSASSQRIVAIRLVPPGVILPPAGTPKASFVVTPAQPLSVNASTNFDASASCPATDSSGNCPVTRVGSIVTYAWSFGDGSTTSGVIATHSFTSPGTFTVTLTVTNDRSVSASSAQQVTVALPSAPTADFVFSPASANVNDTVVFNADTSKAATGHTLVQFSWNFGDNDPSQPSSGFLVNHKFAQPGTYNVTLSVLDDTGQKATTSKVVTIGNGNPVAIITFSPTTGVHPVTIGFSSSGSTTSGGATITSYQWDFGDPTSLSNTSSVSSPSHQYLNSGSYTVRLTITDSQNRTSTTTVTVPVS